MAQPQIPHRVSMRVTVVPNRNAIMLDIAVAVAVARKADAVAFGAHAGDHAIYPDCRPEFVERFARMANEGLLVEGFEIVAPSLTQSKADIVRIGATLEVHFEWYDLGESAPRGQHSAPSARAATCRRHLATRPAA